MSKREGTSKMFEESKKATNVHRIVKRPLGVVLESDQTWKECYSSVDRKTGYGAQTKPEEFCSSGSVSQIVDKDARRFWNKNFKERTAVTNLELLEAMELSFPLEDAAVLQIICQYVACHIEDPKLKDCSSWGKVVGDEGAFGLVTVSEFNRLTQRFRPFDKCIANASKALVVNRGGKYSLAKWYHGFVKDWTSILKANPDKFLVREPRKKGAHHILAVEHSKIFERNGKQLLGMNTNYLTIHRSGLFVWLDNGKKKGHQDIDVALRAITGGKEPIISKVYDKWSNTHEYKISLGEPNSEGVVEAQLKKTTDWSKSTMGCFFRSGEPCLNQENPPKSMLNRENSQGSLVSATSRSSSQRSLFGAASLLNRSSTSFQRTDDES
mmetsp:Transcript_5314/g.9519  ORF Transcript_5314/g.9519 Transcript_5314/m.9519 type:complete len:382 (-) Transcript_5314:278-1423(-)